MTTTFLTLALASLIGAENLAAGKPYRLEPAPKYEHCTDPDDSTQLTDGQRVRGYFWTQKGTVGWSGCSHVIITIDLGAVRPISGLSYHTAAGVAGVELPAAVVVLVSDDRKVWHEAGDLVASSSRKSPAEAASGYAEHVLRTDELAARGRYVALLVEANGAFVFVDEVEVFRGPDSLLSRPLPGQPWSDVGAYHEAMRINLGVRRRLAIDLDQVVRSLKAAPVPEAAARALEAELEAVRSASTRARVDDPASFRTVFPVSELHRRIFAVQAAVWRARGLRGVVAWPAQRWDMLSPTALPAPGDVTLDVSLMNNEYRSAAFNLSNAGRSSAQVRLVVEGLPDGVNPAYITVHEVPFTDTRSGVPVAAALPLVAQRDGRHELDVPPGLTRQVWFTVHPRHLPPGDHNGRVRLVGEGVSQPVIPLRLHIAPITFPDHPALHLGGWDYTDRPRCYEVTPQNREAFLRHLSDHFVDTPWAQSAVLPTGTYDADGRMVTPPDPAEFRTWLDRWPAARRYFVFAQASETFAGFRIGTPAFERAIAAWINWWVNKLGEWKIAPDQLGLLIVDEPYATEQDRIIIGYARVIRAAQPKVVIWEDPTWRDPAKATPGLFEACDVLCPNLPMWIEEGPAFAKVYLQQQQAGRRLWFYSCSGPVRLLDPYGYHRLSAWSCWKYGAEGEGFWAFGDSNGASSWNEYLSSIGAFTPLFLDTTTVTAGKHMEAIREGVEDFEYLHMLRDRVQTLERQGVMSDDVARARALLATAADRVLGGRTPSSLEWKTPGDRNLADRVRIELLDSLVRLARY